MKIINESDTTLTLKDSNWGSLITGIIFIVFGSYLSYKIYNSTGSAKAWIPLIFAAFGILIFLSAKSVTILFDKAVNIIELKKVSLFGKKNIEYKFDQVKSVDLREQYTMSTSSNSQGRSISTPQLNYQIVLVCIDGSEVPLTTPRTSSGGLGQVLMRGIGTNRVIGQKIAILLGVPFNEIGAGVQAPGISLS